MRQARFDGDRPDADPAAEWSCPLAPPVDAPGRVARAPVAGSLLARLAEPADGLLDVLFERSDAGMVAVDRAGLVVRANAALARMGGGAAAGRPVLALFVPRRRPAVWARLRAVLDGAAQARPFVSRLTGPAGGCPEDGCPEDGCLVRVLPAALREADGSCAGLVLRVYAARPRPEARPAPGERPRTVGRIAAGVAHDVNNLLAPILGAADAALARPDLPPGLADELRLIRASADRGAALVRRMLAPGGHEAQHPRVLALNEAVQDLSGLLRRMLGAGPRLELDLERPGPAVRADPAQLDRVLVNLAVNARNAMPDGGRVWLRTGRTVLAHAVSDGGDAVPAGAYAVVEVADEGVGIPPELLPRIFEPFFTTRRERGGSGLGLASARAIVRRAGGFIGVESRVGQGTRVRVHLPLHGEAAEAGPARAGETRPAPPPAPSPESPPAPPEWPGAGRAVLLVEDQDAVRRLGAHALRRHGWRVLAAASGEDALALVAEQGGAGRLDLAVCDVALPGMDGPALLRALRRRWPGLPAVLCSGYADARTRAEAEALGVPVLQKPYAWRALLARVDAVLEAAAAAGTDPRASPEATPEAASGAASGAARTAPEFS